MGLTSFPVGRWKKTTGGELDLINSGELLMNFVQKIGDSMKLEWMQVHTPLVRASCLLSLKACLFWRFSCVFIKIDAHACGCFAEETLDEILSAACCTHAATSPS